MATPPRITDSGVLDYQFSLFELSGLSELESAGDTADVLQIRDARRVFRRGLCSLSYERSPLMIAAVEGERGNIAGQIAVQMSITAIMEKVVSYYWDASAEEASSPQSPSIVRETFKEANQQVYQYAHRMRAGGRVGATGFVAAYDGQQFSIARVGRYESFLWREGALAPLHERTEDKDEAEKTGQLQRFIGANAQILVDLSTVSVKEGDVFVLSTLPPHENFSARASEILDKCSSFEEGARRLALYGGELNLVPDEEGDYKLERNVMVALLRVGRPVIQLEHVIEEF